MSKPMSREQFLKDVASSTRRMLAEFEHGDFKLSDTWEISGREYTFHFLWCLHAIVWAIQQYDAQSLEKTA